MVASKTLGYIGLMCTLSGIMIGWFIFPPFLKSKVKKATKLKPGGERRPMWEKIPFGIDFKVYLFNITNPSEIEKGEKPQVKEVGPFVYEIWKEKVDMVDFEEDDTVEFRTKTLFKAVENSGGGLSDEMELILPHTLLTSIIMATYTDKPKLISMVGKAIDSVFGKPTSIFYKIKVRDLLFDGLDVDCASVKDVPGKGLCAALKEQADAGALMTKGDMIFAFSLFGARNNTPSRQKWRACRGSKNIQDVGITISFDGKPALETWSDPHCNAIDGTDGTIFAPFLDEKTPIRTFSPDFCRVLEIKYEKPSKVAGIKTARYTSDLGDYSEEPGLRCFCKDPENCLKKGAYDLSPCIGAPMVATLPHFYLADESYLDTVIGLHPEKSRHEIFLDFETFTASPIEARSRMQFNILVVPVEKNRLMGNFPDALLPLFWVEEGVIVPKVFSSQIKMLQTIMKSVKIFKWLMVVGGLILACTGFGLHFNK